MNFWRILPLFGCLLFASFSALANSVTFQELEAVIKSNPDFDGLFEAMKIDDNGEGQRLGRHYGTVAGARVGPYKFRAAFKGGTNEGQAVDLVLHTAWHLQDASGKRYEGDPPEPPPASAGQLQIVEHLQRVEVISLRQAEGGTGSNEGPTPAPMPNDPTSNPTTAEGLPSGTPTVARSLKEGDVKFASEYFTQAFAVPISSGQILEVIMHSTQFRPTILSNFQHWRGPAGARHTPVKGESIARIQQQAKGDDPLIVMLMSEDKHQGGEFRAWFFLDGKLIAPITDFTPDFSFDRISKNKPSVKVSLVFGTGSSAGTGNPEPPPAPAPNPAPNPAAPMPPASPNTSDNNPQAGAMENLWNGTWDSDFGQLRLVQDGRRVYGDYANEGYFEARTDRDRPFILRGTFQKENGDWGLFEFTMAQDRRRFGGPWEWTQKFPTANSARWTGGKTADITGPLVNAVGKSAYWAKPYEKRFPIEVTEWMDTGKLPVSEEQPAPPPNPTPAPQPLPPPNANDDKDVRSNKTAENLIVRVRLYGLEGREKGRLLNNPNGMWTKQSVSGSFYVSARLIGPQGNEIKLTEKSGQAEMLWKRDRYNPHVAWVRDLRNSYVGLMDKDGNTTRSTDPQKTQTPPPHIQKLTEWQKRDPEIAKLKWDNFFEPPLEATFIVSKKQLDQPDHQLRVQVSGFLFELGFRDKEEPKGRAEQVWLYAKDPMKRSGDFKYLEWKDTSNRTWTLPASVSVDLN